MDRKGAIELSANFIIIIIISMVVLASGLGLFFKLKNNAQKYVDTLDGQTEDKLKNIMLNNNYRVAVYPQDPVIASGDATLVGLGITNINTDKKKFSIVLTTVKKYTKLYPNGAPVTDSLSNYYSLTSPTIDIAPSTQMVKGILVRMPKGAERGQYVYTFTIRVGPVGNAAPVESYGVVQVYATN